MRSAAAVTCRAAAPLRCALAGGSSRKGDSAQLRELGNELVLKATIERFCRPRLLLAMVPIASADLRLRILACSQPGLREMTFSQIVWRVRAAHFVGTHPGSTALLKTSGQCRATASAKAVRYSLLSE